MARFLTKDNQGEVVAAQKRILDVEEGGGNKGGGGNLKSVLANRRIFTIRSVLRGRELRKEKRRTRKPKGEGKARKRFGKMRLCQATVPKKSGKELNVKEKRCESSGPPS